jgi:sulfonate transport system ATP-binding protein
MAMTEASTDLLRVNVRRKEYPGAAPVIETLDFVVRRGEFVTLLGPSGCGKTTLLRLISGLDTAYNGEISSGGKLVRAPGQDRGVVFQESRLLPWLTTKGNVEFALPTTFPAAERARRISHILKIVGLTSAAELLPYQLSGGMEKRVALARALVNIPKILLLDEPLAAVDPLVRFGLEDELARIHACEGLTTLLVTHDVDEAVYLSDRVLILCSRPARILDEFRIDLPRPRSRTSSDVIALRQQILTRLLGGSVTGNIVS